MVEFLAYNLVGLLFLLIVVAPLVNHAVGGPMPGACLMAATIDASHHLDDGPGFVRPGSIGPGSIGPGLAGRTARRSRAPARTAVQPAMPRVPRAETTAADGPAEPPPGPAIAGLDIAGLDIAGVEGRMQAASVRRMAEIVDNRPREAAAVLKSWLNEDRS